MIFGTSGKNVPVPEYLSGIVFLGGFVYPILPTFRRGVAAAVACRCGLRSSELVSAP